MLYDLMNNTQMVAILQMAGIYSGQVSKGCSYYNPDVFKYYILSDHRMQVVSIPKFPGNKFLIFQLSENKS